MKRDVPVRILTREQIIREKLRTSCDDACIILPSDCDIVELTKQGIRCGHCRNCNVEEAQREMRKQNFVERMLREEKYRLEWFRLVDGTIDVTAYGLCDVFDWRLVDRLAVATCHREDVDESLKNSKKGREKIPCPFFEPVTGKGAKMVVSRSGARQCDH